MLEEAVYLHIGFWGWWDGVLWLSDAQNPIDSLTKKKSLFSSTIFKIVSKTETWQGILKTPICWNPNSSSACLSKMWNAWWLKYSVGITYLFCSSPTATARYPFGTDLFDASRAELSDDRDNVLFRNLMLLLPLLLLLSLDFEVLASFLHFFRICWSLTISLILLDLLGLESILACLLLQSLVSNPLFLWLAVC